VRLRNVIETLGQVGDFKRRELGTGRKPLAELARERETEGQGKIGNQNSLGTAKTGEDTLKLRGGRSETGGITAEKFF